MTSYQPFNPEWEDGAEHKNHPEDGAEDEAQPEDPWLRAGCRVLTLSLWKKQRTKKSRDFISDGSIKMLEKKWLLSQGNNRFNAPIVKSDISSIYQRTMCLFYVTLSPIVL